MSQASSRRFQTTRWSLLLAARGEGRAGADEALASLYSAYWYPLYAFVRRKGHDAHAAALLVSNGDTDTILSFDASTGAFLGTFASGGGLDDPEGLTFGPDGNLYVTSRTNNVLRYSGTTGAFLDVFASGGGLEDPAGLVFGPDGNLYVSSGETGTSSATTARRGR